MKKTVIWSGNSKAQLAGDVKKLHPPRRDLRLSVGDYRIFFLSLGRDAVEILGVKHRSQAY